MTFEADIGAKDVSEEMNGSANCASGFSEFEDDLAPYAALFDHTWDDAMKATSSQIAETLKGLEDSRRCSAGVAYSMFGGLRKAVLSVRKAVAGAGSKLHAFWTRFGGGGPKSDYWSRPILLGTVTLLIAISVTSYRFGQLNSARPEKSGLRNFDEASSRFNFNGVNSATLPTGYPGYDLSLNETRSIRILPASSVTFSRAPVAAERVLLVGSEHNRARVRRVRPNRMTRNSGHGRPREQQVAAKEAAQAPIAMRDRFSIVAVDLRCSENRAETVCVLPQGGTMTAGRPIHLGPTLVTQIGSWYTSSPNRGDQIVCVIARGNGVTVECRETAPAARVFTNAASRLSLRAVPMWTARPLDVPSNP